MFENTVVNVRNLFKSKYLKEDFVVDKTGVKMLEIPGFSFIADEGWILRQANEDYIKREIAWYNSKSLNVYDIEPPVPAIWKSVADKDGFINSNYGWCIFSEENGNQYTNALQELKAHPFSRRAIMIYNRPNMWEDYNKNGRSDFMCTNAVQYLFRNNKLHAFVQMRSNDAVFGYNNDWSWQRYVLFKLAHDLGVEMGDIYWNAGSLHVYERHFKFVQQMIDETRSNI